MLKKIFNIIAVFTIFGFSCNANATLIDNGTTTIDTDTGLEWLDLTATYNMTVVQVLPQLLPAGLFDGYRLALAAEVHTLMSNAGLPVSTTTATIPATAQELANANALTALLGETVGAHFGGTYFGSRGHLDDGGQDRVVGYYTIGQSSLFNDYFAGSPSWPGAGVWLVRATAVPEPAPLTLLALSLLGVAAIRKRRA